MSSRIPAIGGGMMSCSYRASDGKLVAFGGIVEVSLQCAENRLLKEWRDVSDWLKVHTAENQLVTDGGRVVANVKFPPKRVWLLTSLGSEWYLCNVTGILPSINQGPPPLPPRN